MKGKTILLNGDPWVIVDVAPAEPLAEMVAALLEDEGYVAVVRGIALLGDTLAHLGVGAAGASVVLVPEADAEAALALIEETVTDYQGDDLEAAMAMLAEDPSALGEVDPDDDEPDDDDEPADDASDDVDHASERSDDR
ncbi:MAG: hypothetical protein K0A98_01995 [Trueperaceae bacterium]|nr:hypothetical protein [Trueperaceae bacterium]